MPGIRVERPSPVRIIEVVCWVIAGVAGVSMLVMMPWVGEDAVVPGTVWLGYPIVLILLFGGIATAARLWREQYGQRITDGIDRAYDTNERR